MNWKAAAYVLAWSLGLLLAGLLIALLAFDVPLDSAAFWGGRAFGWIAGLLAILAVLAVPVLLVVITVMALRRTPVRHAWEWLFRKQWRMWTLIGAMIIAIALLFVWDTLHWLSGLLMLLAFVLCCKSIDVAVKRRQEPESEAVES